MYCLVGISFAFLHELKHGYILVKTNRPNGQTSKCTDTHTDTHCELVQYNRYKYPYINLHKQMIAH